MRRSWIIVGVIVAAIIGVAVMISHPKGQRVMLGFLGAPTPEEMYPPAPPMPPVVATPVEELLAQYEIFLGEKAPTALSALQPGLTDAEIDRLEQQHNVTIPTDLRALYRWRNGTRAGVLQRGPRGVEIGDFEKAEQLWKQYGAEASYDTDSE